MSAGQTRAVAAEQGIATIRLLVVAVGTIAAPVILEREGTVPWLAYLLLVCSWLYAIYIYRARPNIRYPILRSHYLIATADAAAAMLWLHATGGFHSPFYVTLYLGVIAVAFRHPGRDVVFAILLYACGYLGLLAWLGQLHANLLDALIRVAYIFLAGGLGSAIARELVVHTRDRVEREERTRSAASRHLAAIVESTDDSVMATTFDGTITAWNRASERLFGYTTEEMIGARRLRELVPEDRYQEQGAILDALRRGRPIVHFETVRLARDGRRIDVSLTLSPLRDEDGQMIGATGIIQDISTRKQAQEALHQKHLELERSNADLEQFAYAASHDLQEPLRMVASYTELLAVRYQGRLDERADKYIHYAVDGATRMQQLINDLLAYSRVGAAEPPQELVDMSAVVDECLRDMQVALRESEGAVTRERLPAVRGDPALLRQLFQNLIGNALKFRSEEPPRVHIAAERRGADWVLSVSDNGIGIDPAFADRIFRVFQRLHERGRYPGSGIGLAIAKKIVTWHGGRIWMEPGLGKGARFCFTVPAEDDSPAA